MIRVESTAGAALIADNKIYVYTGQVDSFMGGTRLRHRYLRLLAAPAQIMDCIRRQVEEAQRACRTWQEGVVHSAATAGVQS